MSTVSSNADISTKYQRVAAEYAKLKVQVAALKNAVITEQEKNQKLSADLHSSESALRRLQNEKEGFEFRNSQLMKRVESLQYEIDDAKQTASKRRGLLFQKNSHPEHSSITGPNIDVLEQELQEKVAENEALHRKISELENEYTETTSNLNEQYRKLEIENRKLREEIERIKTGTIGNQSTIPLCDIQRGNVVDDRFSIAAPESRSATTQNLVLNCERAAAMRETVQVLWLDALRTARMLSAGFANLLQLFEQRSTIYPNDINMEKLPERTLLYGRRLLSSCDMFEACSSSIESILVKSADDDCLNLSVECSKIAPVITGALRSCAEWEDLFCESIAHESRLSWCSTNLSKCNEDWIGTFLGLLRSLGALSDQIDQAIEQQSALSELFVHVQKLPTLSADCTHAYTAKIFNENHIPTATKRLRCVNECICKCLTSLHRNVNSFVALLQLLIDSGQMHNREENMCTVPETAKAPLASTNVCVQNDDLKEEANESGEQADVEPEKPKSSPSRVTTDFLKSELEIATKRIVELEKEKERIIVDFELLKTKLRSVKSARPGISESEKPNFRSAGPGISESEKPNKDVEMICSYFQERIGDLHADIEHIRSRALYYKHECKDLLSLAKLTREENETLRDELHNVTTTVSTLKEELEMTRRNYEEQLQNLHEHIADLNIRLAEQLKTQKSFKDVFNGVSSSKQSFRKPLFK